MLVYWLLFAYFAAGALMVRGSRARTARNTYPLLALGAVAIALLVGLRFEVGGDWNAYLYMFRYAGLADLDRVLARGDPGYQFLNWFVQQLGVGLWLVNLVCGAVFAWGLYRLSRTQPDPWLAMLVSIPYLVVVVAMGYSRQAVAIGLLMAGLASVERGSSTLKFALYTGAAAVFHRTAIVGLPLVAFASRRNWLINVLVGLAATYLLYDVLLEDEMETLIEGYIKAEMTSQGAAIRVAMSLVPAAFFLVKSRDLGFGETERKIWRNFSLAAFFLLALLFILPSSTVVDRLALYILPLQLVVLSRLPGTMVSAGLGRTLVVLYSFAVQFTWLNYAGHAEFWLPYQFYPFT